MTSSPPAAIVLNQPVAAHRGTVSFSYTLPKQSKGDNCSSFEKPCAAIEVKCWQGDVLVFATIKPARGNSFYLESGQNADGTPVWPDGPATCTATLGDYSNPYPRRGTWTEWASTTLSVEP